MKRMIGTVALLAGLFALLANGVAHATTSYYFQPVLAVNDTITPENSYDLTTSPGSAKFSVDSSAVIRTGSFGWMAIGVRVIPAAGDTATRITLAITISAHLVDSTTTAAAGTYADSAQTFVWQGTGMTGASGGVADSTGDYSDAGSPTLVRPSPYRGEILVGFSPFHGRGGTAVNSWFGAPAGKYIMLQDSRGNYYRAGLTTIKVRCLTGAAKPRVSIYLFGGQL